MDITYFQKALLLFVQINLRIKLTVKATVYVQSTVTAGLILFMFIISLRIGVHQNFWRPFD